MFGGLFSSFNQGPQAEASSAQQPAANSTTLTLEQEKQRQAALISQKLKSLELENEFLYEKMTQKGLIAAQSGAAQGRSDKSNINSKANQQDHDEDESSNSSVDEENKSYLEMAQEGYEQLVNAIIRPPRCRYKISDLGPRKFWFGDREFERTDTTLMTERGFRIELSVWGPQNNDGSDDAINYDNQPFVIYLHGNASARLEVLPQLTSLLCMGLKVVTLDFAGSGLSDGDYVSLGFFERHDLAAVITHLRMVYKDPPIALWGRSMGAATALMYGAMDGNIRCMILDSSFSSLVTLAEELVDKARQQGMIMPGVLVSAALRLIQWSVQKRANFDIYELVPLVHARNGQSIPAIFVHADEDDFIRPKHSQDLCEVYPGAKSILIVAGQHNDPRPESCLMACEAFLDRYLDIKQKWKLRATAITRDIAYPPWYQSNQYQRRNPRRQRVDSDDVEHESIEIGMTNQRQQEIQDRIHHAFGGRQQQIYHHQQHEEHEHDNSHKEEPPLTVDSILGNKPEADSPGRPSLAGTLDTLEQRPEHKENDNVDNLEAFDESDHGSLEPPQSPMPVDDPPSSPETPPATLQTVDDDDDDDDEGFGIVPMG